MTGWRRDCFGDGCGGPGNGGGDGAMRIALDVDGVLADVIRAWLEYSNGVRPRIAKSQITDWDFWRGFGIKRRDFYEELDRCWKDGWRSIPPTDGGIGRASGELGRLGRVDIVTARDPSTDPYVREWLDLHGISYRDYVSVPAGPMKADLDYDVFIDDSPLNAAAFLDRGRRVVLYTQPWNLSVAAEPVPAAAAAADVAASQDASAGAPAAAPAPAPTWPKGGIRRITRLSEAADAITAPG